MKIVFYIIIVFILSVSCNSENGNIAKSDEKSALDNTRPVALINPSNQTLTVKLLTLDGEGIITYIPPQSVHYDTVKAGNYFIRTYDKDKKLLRSYPSQTDTVSNFEKVTTDDGTKVNLYKIKPADYSKFYYYNVWFDVLGENIYAVVNTAFLYEGQGGFNQLVLDKQKKKKMVPNAYYGNSPFIPGNQKISYVLDPFQKIPKEVSFAYYKIIMLDKDTPKEEVYNKALEKVTEYLE